jgi:hypothetical protein
MACRRVELCRKLAHREQRGGGCGALGHHSCGERPDHFALDVPVLNLTKAILQLL